MFGYVLLCFAREPVRQMCIPVAEARGRETAEQTATRAMTDACDIVSEEQGTNPKT